VIDLGDKVNTLCMTQTRSFPTRAHMLAFNASGSHAILAYVATGHVVFFNAATRAAVSCIKAGMQAHAAFPSPDGKLVIVADQNGKKLARLKTDYAAGTFTLDEDATLDLATCTTPSGAKCQDDMGATPAVRPDNAPVCPIVDASSRWVFVTLRGGGMFVVDPTGAKLKIVAEYDRNTVHPNGCGGVERGGKMYVSAGGGTMGTPVEAHVYSFALSGFKADGTPPNMPAPADVFAKHGSDNDTHGMALLPRSGSRYLWVADRMANAIDVVDTAMDKLDRTFSLARAASMDPAPDLMAASPDGNHVFVALRGECPLTANLASKNNAVGATPGVGVITVRDNGQSGELTGVARIESAAPADFDCPGRTDDVAGQIKNQADPHTVAVRAR
jgi:DNA-binding beta-propeller fold protein YncE